MTVRELRRGDPMAEVKRLYISAFPKEERKPYSLIKRLSRLGKEKMLGIFDSGELLGIAFTVERGKILLVDYLAVLPEKRNTGVGAAALDILSQSHSDKVMLIEIEDPDTPSPDRDIRMRRRGFYERCGYRRAGILVSLFGVKMELLTKGGSVTFEEYRDVYSYLLGKRRAEKYVTEA